MQIMKDLKSQIKFIDKVMLPLFGIKSVCDYETIVYLDVIENTFDITQLNDILVKIKEIFPVKDFNFHKTHHTIISPKHAFNILKTCLNIALIPHSVDYKNKRKYLRLFSSNITLHNYIMQLQAETSDIRPFEPSQSNYTPNYMHYHDGIVPAYKSTYDEMLDNIKKETVVEFIFNLDTIYNKEHNEIRIDIKSLMIESAAIKNIKIDICSTKLRNSDILARNFVQNLFKTSRVKMLNSEYDNTGIMFPLLLNELIFEESFIFPLSPIIYHTLIFAIDNVSDAKQLTNLMELKLTLTTVDFYSDFNKQLKTLPICIPMTKKDGSTNTLRIISGMWGFGYDRFRNPTSLPTQIEDEIKKIGDNIQNINGGELNLLHLKGFELESTSDHDNLTKKAIVKLVECKYDFCKFALSINPCDCLYFTKSTELLYHHYYNLNLPNMVDTICNILIYGKLLELDINEDVPISFLYTSRITKKGETNKTEPLSCCVNKVINTDLLVISNSTNHHINLLNATSMCLVVTTNSENKPLDLITINYNSFVWDTKFRRKMAQECNSIIELSTLIV